MIQLETLSKQYFGKTLFRNVSLRLGDRERIALVGPNGAGKSTMMKIIAGLVEADSGRVVLSRSESTGYLPQDGVYHRGRTLFEETASVFSDLEVLQDRGALLGREIAALSEALGPDHAAVVQKLRELGNIQGILEHRGAYSLETRIRQILSGLGFRETDFHRMAEEFSGGWQMRIELAKLLLREPTVLLLDEPTNHLDMDSLEWLETYLKSYEGAMILVSHDSRFLDNLVERVVEISQGEASVYTGNYSSFVEQRTLRVRQREVAREKQEAFIEESLRFIERFRYKNTKAKQVQSRIRVLEKMDLVETAKRDRTIAFRFPDAPRAGKIVMELSGITKSYGTLPVFSGLSLQIGRTDRAALLGVNGSGKSTLARIIAGTEPFQEGRRIPGHQATIAYYSQDLSESLDLSKTVYETVLETDPSRTQTELRTLLGSFLFSGEDVQKTVSVLSGGEKSRLALAKMLLAPANLLVLDEPTNHLDIASKGILQERLLEFPGACVIVSHDRDFLGPLIDRVLEVGGGAVRDFRESLEEYLERKRDALEKENREKRAETSGTSAGQERERKRLEAERRQVLSRKLKPLREDRLKVEEEIRRDEKRKAEMERILSEGGSSRDGRAIQDLQKEYHAVTRRLEELYDRWGILEEEIGRIEKDSP